MPSDVEHDELVQSATLGSREALKILLTDSREELCRFVQRKIPALLGRLIEADDVVQETHVEVFKRIGQFTSRGNGSFGRWVKVIALSRLRNVVNFHRTLRRGGDHTARNHCGGREDSTIALLDLLAAPGATPSRCIARDEAIRTMQQAIEALPPLYRDAVRMVYLEGQKVRVVAERLGRSERAVHGLCRRALGLLRDYLVTESTVLSPLLR